MPGNPYLHTAHKIKSYVPFLRVFCLRGKEYRRMAKELSEGLLCARFLADGEPWIREENCIRKEKRITHYGILFLIMSLAYLIRGVNYSK